jgi:hypothetical protein
VLAPPDDEREHAQQHVQDEQREDEGLGAGHAPSLSHADRLR